MTPQQFVTAFNRADQISTKLKVVGDKIVGYDSYYAKTFKNGTPPTRGEDEITIPPKTLENMGSREKGVYHFYQDRLAKWADKMYPDAIKRVDKQGFGWRRIPLADKKGPVYTYGAAPFVFAKAAQHFLGNQNNQNN